MLVTEANKSYNRFRHTQTIGFTSILVHTEFNISKDPTKTTLYIISSLLYYPTRMAAKTY